MRWPWKRRPKVATLVYVCYDCLTEVAAINHHVDGRLPPAIEVHSGDRIPFSAYKHYCAPRETP